MEQERPAAPKIRRWLTVMLIVFYFILGFVIGTTWGYRTTRTQPAQDTVHRVVERIKTYHGRTGNLPSDLNFISDHHLNLAIERHGLRYDPDKKLITTAADCYYYDHSFLYTLTNGLFGYRVMYSEPGSDLSYAIDDE